MLQNWNRKERDREGGNRTQWVQKQLDCSSCCWTGGQAGCCGATRGVVQFAVRRGGAPAAHAQPLHRVSVTLLSPQICASDVYNSGRCLGSVNGGGAPLSWSDGAPKLPRARAPPLPSRRRVRQSAKMAAIPASFTSPCRSRDSPTFSILVSSRTKTNPSTRELHQCSPRARCQ